VNYHIASTYQDKADRILDIVTHFESQGNINIKSFKVPNLINKIAYRYFRTSKARRSFEYGNQLLENGVLTPAPYVGDENMLSAFAKFTYGLHQKQIHFLDHSPGNTLIVIKDDGYDFYLVDLNRMEFGPMDFMGKMLLPCLIRCGRKYKTFRKASIERNVSRKN